MTTTPILYGDVNEYYADDAQLTWPLRYFIEDEAKITADRFDKVVKERIAAHRACVQAAAGWEKAFCPFQDVRPGRSMREGSVRLNVGMYARALAVWWRHFPRDQLLVVRAEDLKADPGAAMRKVFDHLHLAQPDDTPAAFARKERGSLLKVERAANVRDEARTFVPHAHTTARLRKFFAPFNQELAMLLDDEAFLWRVEAKSKSVGVRGSLV